MIGFKLKKNILCLSNLYKTNKMSSFSNACSLQLIWPRPLAQKIFTCKSPHGTRTRSLSQKQNTKTLHQSLLFVEIERRAVSLHWLYPRRRRTRFEYKKDKVRNSYILVCYCCINFTLQSNCC